MANRKQIELNFSEDIVKVTTARASAKADQTAKKLNFGGLVIEVKPKAKKEANKNLNSSTNESSAVNSNGCVPKKPAAIQQPSTSTEELKSTNQSKDQLKPTEMTKLMQIEQQLQEIQNERKRINEERERNKKERAEALEIARARKTTFIDHKILSPKALSNQIDAVSSFKRSSKPSQPYIRQPFNDVGAAGLCAQNKKKVVKQTTSKPSTTTTEDDWNVVKGVIMSEAKAEMLHYDRLLELSKSSLLKNKEDFVCSICERFVLKGEGIMLKGCLHNACKICLVDEIQTNFDIMGRIKCPFRGAPCESFISDEEVKELLGDGYKDFAMKIMENLQAKLQERKDRQEAAIEALKPKPVDKDVNENDEMFECAVCFTDAEIGEGVVLKNCKHKFCKLCMIEQITHSEDFEVKCPFNDGTDNCEFKLQEREIRGLVTAEVFDKHLEKSLKLYEAAAGSKNFHCKTPDCRGFYELMDANVRGFTCEVCSKVNCIGCKAIHQGKNCQQYQEEVNPNARNIRENAESENAIQKMIDDNQALWCPRCGIPVMKDQGCDYILCTACKLGICWCTKKPRQPITLEDGRFIDGCHCREKGDNSLCHPSCKFCH